MLFDPPEHPSLLNVVYGRGDIPLVNKFKGRSAHTELPCCSEYSKYDVPMDNSFAQNRATLKQQFFLLSLVVERQDC